MAKAAKKVKWSVGADEPSDLQEFLSNDEIVDKNRNKKTQEVKWPSKGPHTVVVRKVSISEIKGGDNKGEPRLRVMSVLKNPKGEDQSFNGYAFFDGFNVTEQGKPYLKRWLKSVGLTWKDFYDNTKAHEEGDNQVVTQIGGVKFDGTKDVTCRVITKVKDADDYNDDDYLDIARYIPSDDEPAEEPDEDEEEDEAATFDEDEEDEDEEEEDEDEEDDEDEEEDDEEDEDEDEDEEDPEDELREELNALNIAALKKRAIRSAKKAKVETDDMPTKKAKLVDWVVSIELDEPPF